MNVYFIYPYVLIQKTESALGRCWSAVVIGLPMVDIGKNKGVLFRFFLSDAFTEYGPIVNALNALIMFVGYFMMLVVPVYIIMATERDTQGHTDESPCVMKQRLWGVSCTPSDVCVLIGGECKLR